MKVSTVGIDLRKNVFQAHGVDDHGKVVLRKKLDRAKVLGFFLKLQPCLIEMEACDSAHYRARKRHLAVNADGGMIAAQALTGQTTHHKCDHCWRRSMKR